MLDHLVYAVPNLDEAIDDIDRRFGVRATPGGKHQGRGTHNALLALGNGGYLEIIGPDPEQKNVSGPMPFGIDRLSGPRVVSWAAKAPGIDARVERARGAGFDPGPVEAMTRDTPAGDRLSWRLTRRDTPAGDGLVPFLIDWGDTPHPSAACAQGCTLVRLEAEHPDADGVRAMLEAVGEPLEVRKSERAALIALIRTPKGEVRLR
ncbi:MAG: VOC family protein [Tepidiformaceae bacterium]